MSMDITQQALDHADLVLIVGRDGLVEWSAGERTRTEIANMLYDCGAAIAEGSL